MPCTKLASIPMGSFCDSCEGRNEIPANLQHASYCQLIITIYT